MDVVGLKREVEHAGIPYPWFCPCKAGTSAGKGCTTIPLEGPERIGMIRQSLAGNAQSPMDQRSQKEDQMRRTMATWTKKQGALTRFQMRGFCRWLQHKRCAQRKMGVLLGSNLVWLLALLHLGLRLV